jgi:hypothetical protein
LGKIFHLYLPDQLAPTFPCQLALFSRDWIGYTSLVWANRRKQNYATTFVISYTTIVYCADPHAD